MGYRIKFSKQAGEDLLSIYNYHAVSMASPGEANRIVKNIKETIRALRVFPFRNKRIRSLEAFAPTHVEVWSVEQDGYRALYSVWGAEDEVIVLTVLKDTEAVEKTVKH